MKYTVTDIVYDTDGEDVDLPSKMEIEVPDTIEDPVDIDEFISDKISDETGFCHKGFSTSPEIEY